jgi:acetyl/propionyl-CoA carboxylase alpha subunit
MYKAFIGKREFEVLTNAKLQLINGEEFSPDIREFSKGKFHILVNNNSHTAEIIESDFHNKIVKIRVNNNIYDIRLKDRYDELLEKMGIDPTAGKKVNDIKAPMPGMVLKVMVENGQPIRKGDAIVVLEAMKMENILKAPADGVVKRVNVISGDKVEKNQVMVNLV